jgi:hypothetical protein
MKDIAPQIFAEVTLYATKQGGRQGPTPPHWFGCPCKLAKDDPHAWDCRILLHGSPMAPGETRRVGIAFLSPDEALPEILRAGKFFLWEGRIIGEATVA